MSRKVLVLFCLVWLVGCEALDPFAKPILKERPARQNENRLNDLSLGLQLDEVRKYMGSDPIYNAINPKHAFSNPLLSHEYVDQEGRKIIIDVYVTYAANLGSCPERSYRTVPTVFFENVLVSIGWDYVMKHHDALGVNDLWLRRGREYMYQYECQ